MSSLTGNPFADEEEQTTNDSSSNTESAMNPSSDHIRPMSFPVDSPPPIPIPGTISVKSVDSSWIEIWDDAREKIFGVHPQLLMAVTTPELVSSMMSK